MIKATIMSSGGVTNHSFIIVVLATLVILFEVVASYLNSYTIRYTKVRQILRFSSENCIHRHFKIMQLEFSIRSY